MEDKFEKQRALLVEGEVAKCVSSEQVLEVMKSLPRHEFVSDDLQELAYKNRPLPIGGDQTISQPLIVGVMTELLRLSPADRVLEIGTGSGYQCAILSKIAKHVYSIEIRPELSVRASKVLEKLGISNVTLKVGDGFDGWPEHGPFDAIIVTAAAPTVPRTLVKQLAVGGRMVIPLGEEDQELILISKDKDGIKTEECGGVRFVPMVGKVQQ